MFFFFADEHLSNDVCVASACFMRHEQIKGLDLVLILGLICNGHN